MRKFTAALAFCAALLCLSACSFVQQQNAEDSRDTREQPKPVIAPPLHIGAVHQVYPEQHFAMIRLLGPIPAAGATLITHPADGSPERVGNLCVSNGLHIRNGLITADIRSGTVVKGDRVFLYQAIAAPEGREQTDDTPLPADNTPADDVIPEPSGLDTPADTNTPWATPSPAADTPAVETSVLPDDGTGVPEPTAPSSKLDDIPDTYDGWN